MSSWLGGGLSNYDMLSVNLRLGCNADPGISGGTESYDCTGKALNNGYEQMFVARSTFSDIPPPPNPIPAPPALLLFCSGGLLLAFQRRKGGF